MPAPVQGAPPAAEDREVAAVAVRNLSWFFVVAIASLTAAAVAIPTPYGLWVVALNAGLLVVLRWVARAEGRRMARQ